MRHDHVGINVADLAQAEAWYAAAFGLTREFATCVDVAGLDIVMLRNTEHGHRVELLREALSVRPGTVSHVAWTTGDLGAEREHMAGAGCGLLTTSAGGAVADWFSAPLFGHPVEIHQPGQPVLDFWKSVRDARH